MALWGGRFTGTVDPLMDAFNASIHFDKRMYEADIRGSQAYAKALVKREIITEQEGTMLITGLEKVLEEWRNNTFEIKPADEDIHTANERRLGEHVGSVAGKLHTGRSRNDQVATDLRIWTREETRKLLGYLKHHWLLSYAWSLQADAFRLSQIIDRLNVLPLGSGALAGNPFNIDREFVAKELGFNGVIQNSLYGVSDRDFVAEVLFWASVTMVHISRLSEDLIIYSSGEFGFVTLADAYSTGSSLMPQKKNPDSCELLRGKSGRVFGQLSGFLMTYKGLPSTYNKDFQEDKEPLFDAVDTLAGSLQITAGVISTLKIHPEKMRQNLSIDMLATDLAEYLVRKGVPFRETHHIAGAAVRIAEERNTTMSNLSLSDFKQLHTAFEEDVSAVWDFEKSIENRSSLGGTSRVTVVAQIKKLKSWLLE
ncbi:9533_t:CDS:2 [Ambispora gerdemannii]|uniref:Argininosuccinate lyase n=1 Tax=Ambispora gerdemannii TaxID=144530 RepID=A0A9N8ZFJ4_9GLOM|nr:9533_t:CDS:2 [Ambispora gerdemannii]